MSSAADNLYRRVFEPNGGVSPQKQFGLTRWSRLARLRQLLSIVRRYHALSGISPVEMREMFEELGPSFIKIGQILSTRSEILPPAYCKELSHLQMDVDPLPFDQVLAALDFIYGKERRKEIFLEIDPTPLGSASLAQVHRAILRENGDVVAIKVQRPGVRITMAQDIDMMRSLAKHLQRFIKGDQIVDIRDVVEELWKTFLEETDFVKEAQNLEEFAKFNKNVAYIHCLKPYLQYCTEEVLVMEYVDGIPINNTQELLACGYDLNEIGAKILDNYATQILDDGFFHGDPHPGNIVIKDGCIVYLDLGNMGRLTPNERSSLSRIIIAVGHESSTMLEEALIGFAVGDTVNVDRSGLLLILDRILEQYAATDIDKIDIGSMLNDITIAMRECKLEMPSCLTSVARSLVTMEGTLVNFVGTFNMVDVINNHLSHEKTVPEQAEDFAHDLILELDRSARGLASAAEYIGDVTHQMSRGQFKMNMEILGSEEPMQKMSRIINRLTLGIVTAGSLVSAALVSTISEPTIAGLPLLSFTGYCVGIGLAIWIVIDIIRHGSRS